MEHCATSGNKAVRAVPDERNTLLDRDILVELVQLRYSSGCSWVLGRHIPPFDWLLWSGLDAPNHGIESHGCVLQVPRKLEDYSSCHFYT